MRRAELSEKIYRSLRREIDAGAYRINSRFPTEKELCQRFSCSHFTIRKVVSRLVDEDILITRRGSGSLVKASFYQHRENRRSIALMYLGSTPQLISIQNYTLNKGYMINVYSQEENAWVPSKEARFLELVKEEPPQALLVFGSRWEGSNGKTLSEISDLGIRVIHYEYTGTELPCQNYILPDYHFAGYMGGMSLLLTGVQNCFYLGLNDDAPFGVLQKRGFDKALRENPLLASGLVSAAADSESHFYDIDLVSLAKGSDREKAFVAWLKHVAKPAGFFCASTKRAAILLEYLEYCGISVPDQATVLGTEILTSDPSCRERMDYIAFDREDIFKKVIDEAVRPDFRGIHEFAQPKLIRTGNTLKMISTQN